jgi:hypothetical protein
VCWASLRSPRFEQRFKETAVSILAQICTQFRQHKELTDIQQFLISLYPHFEAYALTCISEVLFACRDFAGFPGEFLAEILSQPFGDPVSFIPRF